VMLEPLIKQYGIGYCFAVVLLCLSLEVSIPFVSFLVSAIIQQFIFLGYQLAWQLPFIAVAIHCYQHKDDRIGLYNASLNGLGNIGQIICGVINSSVSSFTHYGFGLTYMIGGGLSLIGIFFSVAIPKDDQVTEENNHLCFDFKRWCRKSDYDVVH